MFATFSSQVSPRVLNVHFGSSIMQTEQLDTASSGPGRYAYRVQRADRAISYEEWLADNQALVEARRAEINKKIAAAHARAEERKRINKIRKQLWHFDHDLWQPAAGSFNKEKSLDGDDNSGKRFRGGSFRNSGRKPRNHIKFNRR